MARHFKVLHSIAHDIESNPTDFIKIFQLQKRPN